MCHPSRWARSCRPHGSTFSRHEQHGFRGMSASAPPWAWEGEDMGPRPDGFGVRRPLRFLAYKLELDEKQIAQLARILDELKTERAQAEVDDRRSQGDLADAVAAEPFDAAKAASGADRRVETAKRLRDAVVRALQQLHAILTPEQRAKLAYLMRSGVLFV
jgi:Spy/CpxP family protein refolding chaperone